MNKCIPFLICIHQIEIRSSTSLRIQCRNDITNAVVTYANNSLFISLALSLSMILRLLSYSYSLFVSFALSSGYFDAFTIIFNLISANKGSESDAKLQKKINERIVNSDFY